MTTLSRGERLEITIERPGVGGDGVGHVPDGRIIFVRGAEPGARVEVELFQVRKRFLRGRVTQRLVEGGTAFCTHIDTCGGCPWQRVPREIQRTAHVEHITRLLSRNIEMPALEPIAETIGQGWRSAARLHWNEGRIGYFESRGSVVFIDACPVLAPALEALFKALKTRASALSGQGTLRLTAAQNASSGTVAFYPKEAPRASLRALGEALVELPCCHGTLIDFRGQVAHFGRPENALGDHGVIHPAGAFAQAHQAGMGGLLTAVLTAVGDAKHVLELYAGSGNFTLPIAEAGQKITAVELDTAAAKALQGAAKVRGFTERVTVVNSRAESPPTGDFDVVLLDPPRAGAAEAVTQLAQTTAQRIVYVSCDPATLARDCSTLAKHGWHLVRVQPFDLFPHTGHIETLVVLERV